MVWIARLAEYLERQHNVITRPQCVRALGENATDARVRRGHLEALHIGTYRPPHMPVPVEQAALAAVLRCRPEAWLTAEALLGLFGFEGFSPDGPLRVLVPPERRVTNVPFTVLADPYADRHRTTIRRVPAVVPLRGLADAALFISDKKLRVGVDSGKWAGLFTNDSLRSTMAALPGHAGALRVLQQLDDGVFDSESEGERELLLSILRGFVPPPQAQVQILPSIRVDFAWLAVRFALDYDGRDHHDRDRDRDRDEERSLTIKKEKWEHLRIRKTMLARPEELARAIAEIYNDRARMHGVPQLHTTGFPGRNRQI